ncbi:dTDP-4-dehydrorhamnose 3,5-epimerase [Couchioplanes caeruleus]|uniref:dTDP-4-dehydrorhamnose 3,5-epimerase family protein n=1 Tax=Couchioplanes caeruleus TaxID=56438 RepID=UPI0020C08099|nr:dTDP-4-dehydrorhamnose 3,5-epimerase [Couchioplanes caeruleus]UQU67673.1 dTDP-4-dehydrorhamnose 3,5-epimerase [Couchioplanes caeruleus]
MNIRKLGVTGGFAFTPEVHRDRRGLFVSPLQESAFATAIGGRFPVAQTNHSVSARNVLRGVHFTVVPPGQAKYVYCARGRALDVMVDIRVGSPTFGQWEATELDAESYQAVYFPEGVGHAFLALEDDTTMSYLVSSGYRAEQEKGIDPLDPELGLPWPAGIRPLLSDRDAAAPSLAEAEALGLLPRYVDCLPGQG